MTWHKCTRIFHENRKTIVWCLRSRKTRRFSKTLAYLFTLLISWDLQKLVNSIYWNIFILFLSMYFCLGFVCFLHIDIYVITITRQVSMFSQYRCVSITAVAHSYCSITQLLFIAWLRGHNLRECRFFHIIKLKRRATIQASVLLVYETWQAMLSTDLLERWSPLTVCAILLRKLIDKFCMERFVGWCRC